MTSRRFWLPTLGSLLALVACSPSPTATPVPVPTATTVPATPTPSAVNFVILTGAEDLSQGLAIDVFLPSDVTVNEGDTIVFNKTTAEPHNVVFNIPTPPPQDFILEPDGRLSGNPVVFFPSQNVLGAAAPGAPANLTATFDGTGFLNSGLMQGTQDKFSVTFSKAGSYPYVCLLHAGTMKGTVTVQAKAAARPKSPGQVFIEAAGEIAKHKQAAATTLTTLKGQVPAPATAGGVTTHSVFAGSSDPSGNDYMRFIGGENLTVKVGDKINFAWSKNAPGVPHTVTITGGKVVQAIVVEPQPAGPPKLIFNPEAAAPSPNPPQPPYSGTGYHNSGLIITGGPMPQAYTLEFSAPGTYKYVCLLHDPAGMNGTITVQPK